MVKIKIRIVIIIYNTFLSGKRIKKHRFKVNVWTHFGFVLVKYCFGKRTEKKLCSFQCLVLRIFRLKCGVKYEAWVLSQIIYMIWIFKPKWPKCPGCLEYMSVWVRFQSSCALVHWVTVYPSTFRRPECLTCSSVWVSWVPKCPSSTLWVILNPIGGTQKDPHTSFSLVTSENVGISSQNFLTFSFSRFGSLV